MTDAPSNPAHLLMQHYHDRMPVRRGAGQVEGWLLGADALLPAPESALREWPVSKRVNRKGHGDDGRSIAAPAAA